MTWNKKDNSEKMNIIYEPRGRAKEYSRLALNLYNGCNHGCKYCYVPDYCKLDRQYFYNNQTARNILKKLEYDCLELSGTKDKVLLCFTCDPYQKINDEYQLTRKVLKLFNQYKIPFQILTKAGHRAESDFDLYKNTDAFATTLTFFNEDKSKYYEPQAALPQDRIDTIKKAKELGINTWVSFEPVLNPNEVFKLLDITHDFVDLYKIGKVSNFETDIKINWHYFANEIVKRLKYYKKDYYLKNDLAVYL